MTDQNGSRLGSIALLLSMGGVVLAVGIGVLARLGGHSADAPSYLVFLAFQIAAIALGWVARSTPLGKAAVTTAAVLALVSLTLMS